MSELFLLFVIVFVSLVIVRAGAIALQKTGLSADISSFQSQSAFMGVGFTTKEAETVVSHPVRRRIIRVMMLLGFASAASGLGTLVVTFARPEDDLTPHEKLFYLVVGIGSIWLLWKISAVERLLNAVIAHALKRATNLHILDYEELLEVGKGYTVAHLTVEPGSWLADRTLHDLELASEGVLVLSITRSSGTTLGTPHSRTRLLVGDRILCYGLEDVISHLGMRRAGSDGDRTHALNVERHGALVAEEQVEDRLHEHEGSGT